MRKMTKMLNEQNGPHDLTVDIYSHMLQYINTANQPQQAIGAETINWVQLFLTQAVMLWISHCRNNTLSNASCITNVSVHPSIANRAEGHICPNVFIYNHKRFYNPLWKVQPEITELGHNSS